MGLFRRNKEMKHPVRRQSPSLRVVLIWTIALLIAFLMSVNSAIVIAQSYVDGQRAIQAERERLYAELGERGMTVVHNIALSSQRAVAVQNYFFLTEVLGESVQSSDVFAYGMITDREGVAVVHTKPEAIGSKFEPVQRSEASAGEPSGPNLRKPFISKMVDEVVEAACPIFVAEELWGWARIGMSTSAAKEAFSLSQARLQQGVMNAIAISAGVALLMMALGVFGASFVARLLVSPIEVLTSGVRRVQDGQRSSIIVETSIPELQQLTDAFNEMTIAVESRERDLAAALHKAEEMSRLKSQFLANMSHELRTPLNGIVNFPRILLQRGLTIKLWSCSSCGATFEPDPEAPLAENSAEKCPDCAKALQMVEHWRLTGSTMEARGYLEKILSAGEYLLHIINDLLDFAKLDAGKLRLAPVEFEPPPVVQEVIDLVEPMAAQKQITLLLHPVAAPLHLWADRVKFQQVVTNLVVNAVKFTDNGGRVQVSIVEDGDNIVLSVADTGIGIPEDKLDVIFESFRQVDGSHTRAHLGTGLGLTITKQLVELHGGSISVKSKVGEGSTFFVHLPKAGPKEKEEADSDEKSTGGLQALRAVVIDDDAGQREVARAVLQSQGFEVILAANSEQVVPLIKEQKPDVVVLDVLLPQISGLTILRYLKEGTSTRHIPVFISTAYGANRELVENLGGIWLPKPWDGDAAERIAKAAKVNRRTTASKSED